MTAEAVGVVVGQILCALIMLVGVLFLIPFTRRAMIQGWRNVTRGEVTMISKDDWGWGSRSRHPAGKQLANEEDVLRYEARETDEGRGDLFND